MYAKEYIAETYINFALFMKNGGKCTLISKFIHGIYRDNLIQKEGIG